MKHPALVCFDVAHRRARRVFARIAAAMVTDDFPVALRAAGRLGFSEQMGQMCTHMGAGAPGFTEQALHFHHTADRISVAARDRDRARVLTELGATLETCTAYHAAWKQQVVDESTWTRLTSSAPPTPDFLGAPDARRRTLRRARRPTSAIGFHSLAGSSRSSQVTER